MGLLTKIFGNRDDRATGVDDGSEESVESNGMHEPDDNGQSRRSKAPAGVNDPAADGSSRPEAAAADSSDDTEAEDPDEIDVSDQLEELDDADAAGDLDASDDLIIEDDEEEETSTRISVRDVEAVNGAAPPAPPSEERIAEMNLATPSPSPGTAAEVAGEDALSLWLGPVSSTWAADVQRTAMLLQGSATKRDEGDVVLLSRLSQLLEAGARAELLRVVSGLPLASLQRLFVSFDTLTSLHREPVERVRQLLAIATAHAAQKQAWLPELGPDTALRQALSDLEQVNRELEDCDSGRPGELAAAQKRWRDAVTHVSLLFSGTGGQGLDRELTRASDRSTAPSLGSVAPETSKPDPERMSMPSETKTPKQTLVEAGTEFKGTLKSSCPVVVNGTIDGEIDAPTLSIARTGAILGSIKAQTLRSQGTLSGNVDAGEVFVSGAVRSKTVIKARRLEVKIGSVDKGHLEITFGTCDLELGDVGEPAVQGAPSPSTEAESDLFTSSGWESIDVGDGNPAAVAASGRSTSKASRRNDGSGDDTKTTSR